MILFILFCLVSLAFVVVAALAGRDALIGLSITYVLMGNMVVGKLFPLAGMTATVAAPMFVMIYILSNILNQYYGKDIANKTVWYAFGANIMAMILGIFVMQLPDGTTPDMDQAMHAIFGFLPRVVAGSLIAFIISMQINVRLYALLKKRFQNKFILLPGFVASPVAILVDTALFTGIAFGIMHPAFWDICLTSLVLRIAIMTMSNPIMQLIEKAYQKPNIPYFRMQHEEASHAGE